MPTLQQLQKAVSIAEKIQALEAELDSVLGRTYTKSAKAVAITNAEVTSSEAPKRRGRPPGKAAAAAAEPKKRGPKKGSKRVLSEEARAKIAEAQKRRWAKNK